MAATGPRGPAQDPAYRPAPPSPASARASCFPAWDELPTSRPAAPLVAGEFLGRDPAVHGQVVPGRLQVLTHRDDVAARFGQIAQRARNLVGSLAHAEDQVRLRDLASTQALRGPAIGRA